MGPGATDREWEPRVLLAHAIADKVFNELAGREIPTEGGAVSAGFISRLEAEIKQALPSNCGLDVVVTIDVASGLMAVEICASGRSAYEEAKATGGIIPESVPAFASAKLTGADYVRCRACASTGAPIIRNRSWIALNETCQPLNGPDDMLCPCGKLREPYDCQADEWIKA